MNRGITLTTATGALALLALGMGPTATAGNSVVIGLNDTTSWSQGCFAGICLCPIAFNDNVTGTAVFEEIGNNGSVVSYLVTDVNWVVGEGDFATSYTGSGTYTRMSSLVDAWTHELKLDLTTSSGATVTFESGVVNGGVDFPNLAISIDTGLDFEADCTYGTILSLDMSALTGEGLGCYRADLDRDRKVGFSDLSMMLGEWGACLGCAPDLSENDVVGFEDLTDLLTRWGTCS